MLKSAVLDRATHCLFSTTGQDVGGFNFYYLSHDLSKVPRPLSKGPTIQSLISDVLSDAVRQDRAGF